MSDMFPEALLLVHSLEDLLGCGISSGGLRSKCVCVFVCVCVCVCVLSGVLVLFLFLFFGFLRPFATEASTSQIYNSHLEAQGQKGRVGTNSFHIFGH